MNNTLKTDKAYIASNKYIVRTENKAGSGVVVSYDEEIEKAEAVHPHDMRCKNHWYDILIPSDEYLLDFYKPFNEQNAIIKSSLQKNENLQTLFYGEAFIVNERIKNYISTLPEETRFEKYIEEMEYFYEKKIEELKKIESGEALIKFVKNHTKTDSLLIAISFLSDQCGILGCKYEDDMGTRVMIFDAQTNIQLLNLK